VGAVLKRDRMSFFTFLSPPPPLVAEEGEAEDEEAGAVKSRVNKSAWTEDAGGALGRGCV